MRGFRGGCAGMLRVGMVGVGVVIHASLGRLIVISHGRRTIYSVTICKWLSLLMWLGYVTFKCEVQRFYPERACPAV